MGKSRQLRLSALDLVFCGQQALPIQMLFKFSESDMTPESLVGSLHDSLEAYWPLKALLVEDEKDQVIAKEIDAAEVPYEVDQTPSSHPLKEPIGTFESPTSSFRWTRSARGEWQLGVSLSHSIVDGYSFFLFLSDWAARARGETPLRPVLDRGILNFGILPHASFNSEDVFQRTGLHWADDKSESTFSRYERLTISEEAFNEMKTLASSETQMRLSDNDLICAHLLKNFAEASSEEILALTMPVDIRRLMKSVGPLYFGNALRPIGIKLARREIQSLTLTKVAERISTGVKSLRPEMVIETYQYLETLREREGLKGFQKARVVDPKKGLLVTNLSRLPLDQINFGFGAPTDVQLLTRMSGAAAVLPSEAGVSIQWAP